LLLDEIKKADYLLFSPHAKFDWPTLAARLAIKLKRQYGVESDYDRLSVGHVLLDAMPFGVRKLRMAFWTSSSVKQRDRCFSQSSLALLQGQEVYEDYKSLAPNPRKVLNVQVAPEDQISTIALREKLGRIKCGEPLVLAYAGRMVEMKGPLDWLMAMYTAVKSGVELQATWFGDGPLMPEMRQEVERLGIGRNVALAGILGREELIRRLFRTDIFLFCHKTGESPRCLGEALAAGCLLVGYGSAFPRSLVARHGGGEFAVTGDWNKLASIVIGLDQDRARLGRLVQSAAASGKELDRETAIQERIDLIKKYLA
jgi:glycosyltransferase involved in cell wall biosynthesis